MLFGPQGEGVQGCLMISVNIYNQCLSRATMIDLKDEKTEFYTNLISAF